MNDQQKPFACDIKGCQMTFMNEDHLNWHKKKHDMVLNIGLANKNSEVVDQTPTPTRFIRNCEEVGLFQDLQNVNPFDEFFKKAVEVTKSGGALEVHEISLEDSLHTPHILPHIEGCNKHSSPNENINDNSNSNEFTLNNVIPMSSSSVQSKDEKIVKINEVCSSNSKEICQSKSINDICKNVYDKETIQITDVKMKIKHTLQVHGKQKNISNVLEGNTILVDFSKKMMHSKNFTNDMIPVSKEKIRAMNRAAQVRCRKRKAQKWQEMEDQIEFLKKENKILKLENRILKKNLIVLENAFDRKKGNTIKGKFLV